MPEGYKQTEVGVIPKNWEVVPYSAHFDIISGIGFNKSEYASSGIKLLRIDNVSYGEIKWDSVAFLPESYAEKHEKILLKDDDILLALNRPITNDKLKIARLKASDLPAILYQRVGKIIFLDTSIDPLYSYYMLSKTVKEFVEKSAVGTDQPFISTQKLKDCRIVMPRSFREQRLIGKALSDIDTLITSLEKLIAKKRAIKTATMQQLLTGKKRLPEFNATPNGELKGYKQTELGEIPEDWEVATLGTLGDFKNGINKGAESFGFGYPFVNLMDVFGETSIASADSLGLLSTTEVDRKEYKLNSGDVLFVRSSVKPSGVGLTTVVEEDLQDTVFSGFLIRFRSKNTLTKKYKKHCFYETGFRHSLIASSSVSANTNINQDNLKQLMMAIPPNDIEQNAISDVLNDMEGEISKLSLRLVKTQQLKQGMMQELLTGRTRLI